MSRLRKISAVGAILAIGIAVIVSRQPADRSGPGSQNGRAQPTATESPLSSDPRSTLDSSGRSNAFQSILLPAPSPTTTCDLVVIDEALRPIRGAAIHVLGDPAQELLGTTNDQGELRVATSRIAARALVVSHPSFAVTRSQVGEAPPARLEIRLSAHAVLSGRVVDSEGMPVPESCWVIAWTDARSPDMEQVRAARDGSSVEDLFVRPVDAQGRFEIDGLRRGATYTVSAASEHALCVRARKGVRAPEAALELRVDWTYGVLVRLLESGGRELRTSPFLFGRGPSWQCHDDAAKPLHSLPAECGVTTWGDAASERLASQHEKQLLFVAPRRVERLGPIEYSVEVPGYERAQANFSAAQMSSSVVAHVISLTPTVTNFGSVLTRFTGVVPELRTALKPDNIVGLVYLIDQRSETWSFAVRARDLDGYELRGVPFGTYRAWFEVRDGAVHAPLDGRPLEIVVAEQPASFVGDLGRSGGALFDVVEGDGSKYTGALRIRVDDLAMSDTFFDGFDSAPYVLPALPPVNFRVTIVELPGIDAQSIEPVDVSIASQQVFRAVFQLPAR